MNNKTKPNLMLTPTCPMAITTSDQQLIWELIVHFDADDNPESVQTIPLGRFISDTPLSSEEYFKTRSLVAAQSAK